MIRDHFALGVLLALGGLTPSAVAQDPLPKINPDGLTSSEVCGACHQSIFAVWRQSLHSQAWSNSVFQAGYRRTQQHDGPKAAQMCLDCHAPSVRHNGDFGLEQKITAEGVTCDFCHSVRQVNVQNPEKPFELDIGSVKYGPLRKVESPVHDVQDSPLHTRSEFCGGCHEYRNANGVVVLGTYSEWKSSPYAQRGIHCQDCHMPLVPGRLVALNVKDKTRESVNLHDISGSHDLDRVREAITLKLKHTDWIGEHVWLNLEVANVGSGHCFPTGMPLHQAVLEIQLKDRGREIARREVPFRLVLLDRNSHPIESEREAFLKAASVQMDTRLKPEEVRNLDITFRDVKAARLTLNARLFYEYATETIVVTEGQERIEPTEMKFLVASVSKNLRKPR